MITCSIDVTLIDKSKIKVVVRKNGATAKFIELVLIDTPNGQFGDYMIVQGTTKEERAASTKGKILGNGKIFKKQGASASAPSSGLPAEDDEPIF